MLEESEDTYQQLLEGLKERGLRTPSLVVSDAHKGLIAAIRTSFYRDRSARDVGRQLLSVSVCRYL